MAESPVGAARAYCKALVLQLPGDRVEKAVEVLLAIERGDVVVIEKGGAGPAAAAPLPAPVAPVAQAELEPKAVEGGSIADANDVVCLAGFRCNPQEESTDSGQQYKNWREMMMEREKTIETRSGKLYESLKDKYVMLIVEGKVIGLVKFVDSKKYETYAEWAADRQKHMVEDGDKHAWVDGEETYGWEVGEVVHLEGEPFTFTNGAGGHGVLHVWGVPLGRFPEVRQHVLASDQSDAARAAARKTASEAIRKAVCEAVIKAAGEAADTGSIQRASKAACEAAIEEAGKAVSLAVSDGASRAAVEAAGKAAGKEAGEEASRGAERAMGKAINRAVTGTIWDAVLKAARKSAREAVRKAVRGAARKKRYKA